MQKSLVPLLSCVRPVPSRAPRFASVALGLLLAAACGDSGLNLGDDSSRVGSGEETGDDSSDDTDAEGADDAGADDTSGDDSADDSGDDSSDGMPAPAGNPVPAGSGGEADGDLTQPPMSVMTPPVLAPTGNNPAPIQTSMPAPIGMPVATSGPAPSVSPMVPNPTGPNPDVGGCPVGLVNCATSCVDLSADRSNCGACGIACSMGLECVAGACTSYCGDGVLSSIELCDDGNTVSGDGCDENCELESDFACPTPGAPCMDPAQCGDGILDIGEACDDGNSASNDGCADCQVEAGWVCQQQMPGADAGAIGASMCTAAACGDGIIEPMEECDEGAGNNGSPMSTCSATCTLVTCGNGVCDESEVDGTCPEDCLAAD